MGSPNGGIIGVVNPTSFGKCTQTVATSGSTTLTTQPGTRLVNYVVVAGGGGGGGKNAPGTIRGSGAGAGGFRTGSSYPVCGNTGYPIVIGGGGTGGNSGASGTKGTNSNFSTMIYTLVRL